MDIKDILKNKGILDEKNSEKTKKLEVISLKGIGDGMITIKSIGDDTFDMIEKMSKTNFDMNKNAVYQAVIEPNLKSKELQEALDCKANPTGVVRKLFTRAEIEMISTEVGKLSGMHLEKGLIKEIKNS
ncbi:phage tail assembly chaperone [Clostridium beijerinckii]|uniref:phage tail assembly chaperone n=1 Tax=Clostridium beijerinckii TaxID=1520 RepID=UPI001F1E1C6B|nr:hypothetical protein [Clostridium beijerinckii]